MDDRPLAITDDHELLDQLLRIAAAAGGGELAVRPAPDSRPAWRSAPVVLLDARQVRAAVLAGLPRRDGVLVVCAGEPDAGVWEHCVLLGVERTLVLPAGEQDLVAILADRSAPPDGTGRVIGVVGARGGAGASVLAVATAMASLRSGSGTLLVDCDPGGPGLDLLLGLEDDGGSRWTDLVGATGRVPADALHEALPSLPGSIPARRGRPAKFGPMGPGVLSVVTCERDPDTAPPTATAMDLVLESCRRAGETAVIDLPRGLGAAAERAVTGADLTVVVASADVPSCYGARRLVRTLAETGARLGLVVRGPSPGGLTGSDLAEILEVPLIAEMRPQPHLGRDLELANVPGRDPRSPLGRAAAQVLAAVTGRPTKGR